MTIQHPLDNRLPNLLRSGKTLRGIFNGLPSPAIVEMCAYAGFDFVIIDNEHGSSDFETTENMLRAARGAGIVAVVRCLPSDISRVLDMGASAVQIPMVNTVEQARALVQAVRYPGVGQRGSAFSTRAAGFGAFGGMPHTTRSNDGIALIPMLETPEAIANAAAIASVDGVDAVFIGPNDLSHAMGHQNDWACDEVQQAIERGIRAIASTGKCAGSLTLTHEYAKKLEGWGARYFATVTTSLITQAFKVAATAGREDVKVEIAY